MGCSRRFAGLAACLLASAACAADAPSLPPLVADGHLGPGWRVTTLPKQTKPVTRFSADRVDGRVALRLAADGSYGNLVLALATIDAPARLRWSWRMTQPNAATDLRLKRGDDTAAKVCLSFDLPLSTLAFGERQMLNMARSLSGQDLPAATLCWAWGGRETVGALIENPFSRRLRTVVLRNADDPLGQWLDEDRDIEADFRRAFGDESDSVPPVVAVGVGADGDNTGGRSLAHVADLRFGAR